STWVYPPLDDQWTYRQGNAGTTASKKSGYIWTSVAAGYGNSQYAAAGLLLWIIPQSAANTIIVFPFLIGGDSLSVQTSWGPTAHSDGYLNILTRAHDGMGRVITELTSDKREQIWSAGSSGIDDLEKDQDYSFQRQPMVVLRGGAYYELWVWI